MHGASDAPLRPQLSLTTKTHRAPRRKRHQKQQQTARTAMAPMASSSMLVSLSVLLLLLCHSSLAQLFGYGQESIGEHQWGSQRHFARKQQCLIEHLSALAPLRRVQSEAGFSEYFDESHELFRCAGVALRRSVVEPGGLILPSYSNTPRLVYIIEGTGISGVVYPGCPESYQSFHQTTEEEEEMQQEETGESQPWRMKDEHQKIIRLRQGDVAALPSGVARWFYNDGDVPVVAVTVANTNSNGNQLDSRHRGFLLAGGQQGTEQYSGSWSEGRSQENDNILRGFGVDLLAQALGVDSELAWRIQNPDRARGEIIRVHGGRQRPVLRANGHEQIRVEEEEENASRESQVNGLEEAFCFMKSRENIGDPERADVYNPRAGRIASLNSQKLPILRFVQMSVERGHLHRNAIYAPHWNINAHSIVYVLRGSCRMQVVGHGGRTVFDGELRQGQLILVPQHHAVVKRAESAHFDWIAFKTSDNAMMSQIIGKASALRGMPLEVLMSSYQISREEARRLKFNRGQETSIFSPGI